MSRIGRKPVALPAGVTAKLDGHEMTVKGKLGTLTEALHPRMEIKIGANEITVARPSDDPQDRSLHGLTRTLINNMVVGVNEGYKTELEIVGVGYKAEKQGKNLVLSLGFSHQIIFEEKDGITFELANNTSIAVKGINKQLVGQIAAQIREKRPPEPYLGKGVKYVGEKIRRKSGKAGKTGK